jgi:nitrile hydratase
MGETHDGHEPHEMPKTPPQLSPFADRARALASLVIDKGVLTDEEIRRQIAVTEGRTPYTGARMVARSWCDPEFDALLREDFPAAMAQLGVDATGVVKFEVLHNTEKVHHLVVCTLCSCYPRAIIGNPPDWYKSNAYRSRAVREPRAVLAEFGLDLPDDVIVEVHDSTADLRYLVVPARPAGTAHLTEAELTDLVSRDCLIGVALPAVPEAA